jgi:hypothetical protein
MRESESYGKVPLTKLKAAIKQIEEHYEGSPERLENVNVTFEYLIGSFFPKIVENIDKRINDSYTAGYIQGKTEAAEYYANQGNN